MKNSLQIWTVEESIERIQINAFDRKYKDPQNGHHFQTGRKSLYTHRSHLYLVRWLLI